MHRKVVPALAVLTLIAGPTAHAKFDTHCSSTTATSAITGRVQNALGQALSNMQIELYVTNDSRPVADSAFSDASGLYRICAGHESGAGHNTYDVHVRDVNPAPLYATANQPYTTFTNLIGDADFTPGSGVPLRYLTNMTVTPAEISTATGFKDVTWIVRSKAPSTTTMRLYLEHLGAEVTMATATPEGGGPAAGGWNRWTWGTRFFMNTTERLYFSTVRGMSGSTEITERDRQPYTIDNRAPLFGLATSSALECGPGVHADPFSPASPPGTTNPQPIVVHDVCDHYSNGARSGLDPFSLTGEMCTNAAMTAGCRPIDPVLATLSIVWWPTTPLSLGDYYIRWTIADKAGNTATNPIAYRLTITDSGGQTPVFTALDPGNLGSGTTAGFIIGSSLTNPSSYPKVGFRVLDADGQTDLVAGSMRVRVYSGDERTLVYAYDPALPADWYDPVSKAGGGTFDLSSGVFRATGFPLQGKPPGRYIATASISDHGGNGATASWHWVLVAAA